MAKERKPEPLTDEELAEANGEPLPDREQMTVIRGTDPLIVPLLPEGAEGGEWSTDPVPPGT
jgi:hypothetical protein